MYVMSKRRVTVNPFIQHTPVTCPLTLLLPTLAGTPWGTLSDEVMRVGHLVARSQMTRDHSVGENVALVSCDGIYFGLMVVQRLN